MTIFNIGIIGYGGFGKFLHTQWSLLDGVRVMAIAETRASKLPRSEDIKIFTDWRALLRDPEVQLIAIVTQPDTHEEIAKACMLAGKHVLIEKPLAIGLSAAQNILETRDQTGMVAGVNFMMRFNPLLQTIREFTQNGVFGKLRRVDVENYAQSELLPPEHWFWNRNRSGGILIEHAVHFIDLVHFIAPAAIVKVNGLKHDNNRQQEDQIMANVVYEDGLMATHYHAFTRPGFFETTKIKLAFDLADLELHGWIPLWGELTCLVNPLTKQMLQASPFFEISQCTPIHKAQDESRPSGWGDSDFPEPLTTTGVTSGGVVYDVQEIVVGKLNMGKSKQDVYAACVQASVLDLLKKIENSSHALTAPLEAGLKSLEVAVLATDSARA
ncbi:MAG: Gfo/Idh/MocA family protein [Saprospiraceae bacterium]